MSAGKPHLEQIQRWMQSVIMHRGGVAEAVDSPETQQHLDVTLESLEEVIRRSRSLSSADRLEIYVNAYYARLMECLEEEFTVTRFALGDELFAAIAFGYLQSYPSQSYTLGQLGENFPRYLAESRLHASEAPRDAESSWPEFVIELATLERLLSEVYDGPGTERDGPLDASELSKIAPTAWNQLRLVPSPSLRLQRFHHPVHEYWARRRDGEQPAPCLPRVTWLAVNRQDYLVDRHELASAEFTLLREIIAGRALGEAIAAAIESSPADDPPVESQLGAWFARWAGEGFFGGVSFAP